MISIPVDQLPQFLQDMALNDPEIFKQLMADMDEDSLYDFIREQQTIIGGFYDNKINNDNEIVEGAVDPAFINDQRQEF